MDAVFFRALCQEMPEQIRGLRIEKVFAPAPHLWTISVGRAGFLVLHTGRPVPFLMLTSHKPENPPRPGGQAMGLRARVRERRILDLRLHWPKRQVALELSPGPGRWLVLGLDQAPALVEELAPDFGCAPSWPDVHTIVRQEHIWQEFPHITPPVRRILARLDPARATAWLKRLQSDDLREFYVVRDHKGQLQARLWPEGTESRAVASALEAAEQAYGPLVARLTQRHEDKDQSAKERKRLDRTIARLESDRAGLEAMIAGGAEGRWLCAALHGLDKHARQAAVQVSTDDGELVELKLRPEWTVLENMQHRFARAAKGQRGLPVVEARMDALRQQRAALDAGPMQPFQKEGGSPPAITAARPVAPLALPARFQHIKVSIFCSTDGFMVLKGRSAEANRQLVQAARPFDYWLHAKDVAGAHVLILRDHATHHVPEATMLEAACLAALSSHLRQADRGDVLLCLAKDVRSIKGAAAGQVRVDSIERVLRPQIDPGLEERLRIPVPQKT
ncbi:MAG: DUF814 domain-containing protein [Desulfovibrionales bacterium]|nr:DUF814 domain-containing protein [Desulfovibrionales bacterium]